MHQYITSILIQNIFYKYEHCHTLKSTSYYLVYSSPIINEIAGYEATEKRINEVEYTPPESKLSLVGEEVIHTDGEIDYSILGSGPAGSVIAHELTRNIPNAKVLLVESGSLVKPNAVNTEEDTDFYEMNNRRYTVNRSLSLRNGMAVGGGSMINLNLAFPPDLPQIRDRIHSWRKWGYVDNELLNDTQIDQAYEWVKSYVLTRKVGPEEINRNNQLLFEGDKHSDTYYLNTRINDPDGIDKVSSFEAFIYPALHGGLNYKGQLSLISDVKVTKLLTDDTNGVYGVRVKRNKPLDKDYVVKDLNNFNQVQNTDLTIRAKNIIIASGTLGSTGILLNSDLHNN
ncbi:GMC family oxidoreductase N-terminal domain-containing protein [Gammaproteobacteria bacterium]|nr:GMC family oxidoreductase N-terminal domain-containing protein [Gammaproteobacteria bacterium]